MKLIIGQGTILGGAAQSVKLKTLIGSKAVGLATIPDTWTPPFIVITTSAQDAWIKDPKDLLARLDVDPIFDQYVADLSLPSNKAIVRSSAIDETLEDRGLYESMKCEISKESILNTINEMWMLLTRVEQSPGKVNSLRMALVIQPLISAKVFGHLSNERRVSKRITDWVWELESTSDMPGQSFRFGVTKSRMPLSQLPLIENANDLVRVLRSIASHSCTGEHRMHYEWLWDGNRIWVVQKDTEIDMAAKAPGSEWNVATPSNRPYQPRILNEDSQSKASWRKIECVRIFRICEVPTAKVYVLEDQATIERLSRGDVDDALLSDLKWLCDHPAVIRTDIAADATLPSVMLPRTDCILNTDDACAFLIEKTMHFRDQGLRFDQFCFIFHRFIASKACAYSFSKPGISRVLIDSTWGIPDSLLFYPHDSYEVDLDNTATTKRKFRCKTEFIDISSSGAWLPRKSGRPFDWKPSLTKSHLLNIAKISCKISNHLGKPVEIMFFIDSHRSSGHPSCLPWFFQTDVLPKFHATQNIRIRDTTSFHIANSSDLVSLQVLLDANAAQPTRKSKKLIVKLKPQGDLVRSQEFLGQVIDLLKGKDCIVELEGSSLTHSYYMLSRGGIAVSCVDPFNPEPQVRHFHKLVRDLIPFRIESHGEAPLTYKSSPEKLTDLLKAKAVEEAFELFWESNPEKMFEELADLLEVIRSICDIQGKGFDKLLDVLEVKRKERGGFRDGIVLVETREVPLINRAVDNKDIGPIGAFRTLFEDNQGSEASPERTSKHENLVKEGLDYQIKIEDGRFIFPLVPPDVSSLNKTEKILVPNSRWIIELTYLEKQVAIVLRRRAERPSETRQLKLFITD